MRSKLLFHLSVAFGVILLIVGNSSAQGAFGRFKKGVLDAAKEAANESVNQAIPAVPPQNDGDPATGNQAAKMEVERKEREAKHKTEIAERKAEQKAEQDKRWAETEAKQKAIKEEREAATAKMEADRKERVAKQKAEQEEHAQRQKEEEARVEKKRKERIVREKNENREKVFGELRSGVIKTEEAKQELKLLKLWDDETEAKLNRIIAERLAELEKNKFPVSDTFKIPVKMYKEFESGMSLEWCKAQLEKDGGKFHVINNNIELETEGGRVTLIFKEPVPDKPSVLSSCIVNLPQSVQHAQVLEKYKREIPNAIINHKVIPQKLPDVNQEFQSGILLNSQISMIQLTDTVTSPDQTITIESTHLIGKAYLYYHNNKRKVLICESSIDGTVTIPDGLDVMQKKAADMITPELLPKKTRNVAVMIEDAAMAKNLQNLQKEQQENAKKQQQQKNAEALAF